MDLDKVLDIKDDVSAMEQQAISKHKSLIQYKKSNKLFQFLFSLVNNTGITTIVPTASDDFFSTVLNNQKSSSSNVEKKETETDQNTSLANWNSWNEHVRKKIFFYACMHCFVPNKNLDFFRITVRFY